VGELLKFGASAKKLNADRLNPLVIATKKGKVGMVRQLLECGASTEDVNVDNLTPLLIATEKGDIALVKVLLEFKASTIACNGDGLTPFNIAIKQDNSDLYEEFLRHDAGVNVRDKKGNTPLLIATEMGNLRLVRQLLEKGASVKVRNKDHLEEAIVAAAQKGNRQLCKEFLDHGDRLGDKFEFATNRGLIPLVRKLQQFLIKGVPLFLELRSSSDKGKLHQGDKLGLYHLTTDTREESKRQGPVYRQYYNEQLYSGLYWYNGKWPTYYLYRANKHWWVSDELGKDDGYMRAELEEANRSLPPDKGWEVKPRWWKDSWSSEDQTLECSCHPTDTVFESMEAMRSLASHLDEQTFLPYQLEIALVGIFFLCLCVITTTVVAFGNSDWEAASFSSVVSVVFTFLALSRRGSYPHLASVGLRLLLSVSFIFFSCNLRTANFME